MRHENVVNYTRAIAGLLGLDNGVPLRFATVSTISADLGNTCIFPALATGGCLEVRSYEASVDGNLFADLNAKHPIDVLKITPSNLRALHASGRGPEILPRKFLLLGGEAFSWQLLDEVRRNGNCTVFNHYGPTETTIGSLVFPASSRAGEPRRSATVPIGRPIANTEIHVVDTFFNPVPLGTPGALYIGGRGVSSGYLNQPQQTADRFVRSPFASPHAPVLYQTGDLVRLLADGYIEFLGRIDDQVKIRGYRVEPAEVERVLAGCPGVRQAAVIARENASGDMSLVGYVVAQTGRSLEGGTLRSFLMERLPDFMVPAHFVVLDSLPLNANGKVNRHALPDPAIAPGRGTTPAPRDPIEERILAIWKEVLGLPEIGIHDNFFDLGGHSLMATQVISRIRSAYNIQLPVRVLFDRSTVAGLSEAVGESLGALTEDPELSALMAEMEQLSEEDVARLLQSEGRGA